jgi:YidC/Oxa1 family membrane protein insertase
MRKKAARIAGALAAVIIVGVMFIRTTYFPGTAEDRIGNPAEETAEETAAETAAFPYSPVTDFSTADSSMREISVTAEYPEIATERFRAGFSTPGGVMTSLEILTDDGGFLLFSDEASGGTSGGGSGWAAGSFPAGMILAGSGTETPLDGIYQYVRPDENTLVFTCSYVEKNDTPENLSESPGVDDAGGSDKPVFSVRKIYRFDPESSIVTFSVSFNGDISGIQGYTVPLPAEMARFVTHTRKGKTYPTYDGDVIRTPAYASWEGLENSSFAFILLNGKDLEGRLEYRKNRGLQFSVSEENFTGADQELRFFAGPKSGTLLAEYEADAPGISALAYPAGFMKPLVKFFSALLRQLRFRLIPDYGLVIVFLALLIKLTFLSLSGKSIASSEAVRRLQPEIMAIRRNGDLDPFVKKEKTSELYKENRVKPLYGVLNLLIHLLVFITISRIFTGLYDFRDAASPVLSLSRLAEPDTLFSISGFSIRLLPILVLATALIQSRILQAPDSGNRSQTIMSWVIPFLFFALFYRMPSGAVLYWLSQTLFSMAEILIIRKRKAG